MDALKFFGLLAEIIGGLGAALTVVKLLFTLSANAGTKLSKKVGTDNEHTDGAIEYQNRAMKKQVIRAVIFGAIGLAGYLIDTFVK